jgi:hypothetical protein
MNARRESYKGCLQWSYTPVGRADVRIRGADDQNNLLRIPPRTRTTGVLPGGVWLDWCLRKQFDKSDQPSRRQYLSCLHEFLGVIDESLRGSQRGNHKYWRPVRAVLKAAAPPTVP